jgi:SAM-dependent methyltransferase
LEIGGGTGEDAAFLALHGLTVLLTDPSPAMVKVAAAKLAPLGSIAEIAAAEDMDLFADHYLSNSEQLFDGAFSNFAPLNCVVDLAAVARGLARLLNPGAAALLVLFGTCCPGEMLVETLRRRPRQAFRRFQRGTVPARLGQRDFDVVYHRRADIQRAFARWFVLEKRIGIGVAVPPSAAEPWMSGHRDMLRCMEHFDRMFNRPLASLGDHVLYQFRRKGSSPSPTTP